METPFIDIHTHNALCEGLHIYSYMAGSGEPLPETPYSTGIHPWKLEGARQEWLTESITPQTIAIGETGLDYAISTAREEQEKWFRFQLEYAEKLGLPVIIHCVKAYNEIMQIVKGYNIRAIIHGFTGSAQLASQLIKSGFYLSFGENLTRSPKTQDALKSIDPGHMFFETDTCDISIKEIYIIASEITGIPLILLKEEVYNNYIKIFTHDR